MKIKRFVLDTGIGFTANSYLITINKEAILIDAPKDINDVITYLKEHNVILKYLLFTHGHFDHIEGATKLLNEFPNLISYGDINDRDWFIGDNNKNLGYSINFKPTKWFDGDITFNDKLIKVIHTPGHSSGSVSFKIDNNLFAGDFIFKGSIGRTDLFGSSDKAMRESLRKLCNVKENLIIYPGHGDITELKTEKKENFFLRGFHESL